LLHCGMHMHISLRCSRIAPTHGRIAKGRVRSGADEVGWTWL
jgi:hypothetical protein